MAQKVSESTLVNILLYLLYNSLFITYFPEQFESGSHNPCPFTRQYLQYVFLKSKNILLQKCIKGDTLQSMLNLAFVPVILFMWINMKV